MVPAKPVRPTARNQSPSFDRHVLCTAPAERDSQQRLDIQIIRSQNNLKQHLLIDLNKLGIPFPDLRSPPPRFLGHVRRGVTSDGKRVGFVVVAVFQDLPGGRGAKGIKGVMRIGCS